MKRAAILAGILFSMVFPAFASGAALVPLGDEETWGSAPIFATAPSGDRRVFVVERGSGDPATAAITAPAPARRPTPTDARPNRCRSGPRSRSPAPPIPARWPTARGTR